MDQHLICYYIGILIVFITHIYLLATGNQLMNLTSQQLAYLNIAAALLIAYYFLNKENYISW